jgi:transcriptional regulator GlxA family with amidase domain
MGAARGGPRRVVVVAYDGVRFLDVVGPLEVLTVADEQGDFYIARVATIGGGDVVTTTGNRLGADAVLEHVGVDDIDTLLVAGSPDWHLFVDPVLVKQVARLAAGARRMVSVCTGTFALAAAGLFDGRRAATHWRHAAALAQRFPTVQVDPEALYVRDGDVFTSAGIAAGIDVALALVEDDLGADAARNVRPPGTGRHPLRGRNERRRRLPGRRRAPRGADRRCRRRGEILTSRETLVAAGLDHHELRRVELKGVPEPVEVASIGWPQNPATVGGRRAARPGRRLRRQRLTTGRRSPTSRPRRGR